MTSVTGSGTFDGPACDVEDVCLERVWPGGERVRIFGGVTFRLEHGRITCIQGRSGSGKTSLLQIVAGILQPSSGSVHVCGREIWTMPEAERAAIRRTELAFVLQDDGLIDGLTVQENMMLSQPKAGCESIRAVLDSVGVRHREAARPSQLSMGERHRVAVGRALLAGPSVLLIDEPTASLDDGSARVIIDLMKDVRADRGTALLIATHDPAVVDIADDTIRLDRSSSVVRG